MGPKIKAFFLVLLFLFVSFAASSGIAEGFREHSHVMHETNPLDKNEEVPDVRMNHRKLMSGSMLDYDEAGPNHKHDPRRRPGGRG